ncbi:MAG TPA: hypothetical protein PK867_17925, partial [Pirellulales bacterium]|nr:hypothetical protein [Pirellulales bacterium]
AVEAKGNTEQHARQVATRAKTLFDACRFRFWGDVSADKVLRKLAELRADGISVQTSNFYWQAAKQFGKWMVRGGRASVSPIDHLQAMNVAADRRHDRRELSVEEIHRRAKRSGRGPAQLGRGDGRGDAGDAHRQRNGTKRHEAKRRRRDGRRQRRLGVELGGTACSEAGDGRGVKRRGGLRRGFCLGVLLGVFG